ncbi:MAG: DUF2520 domain-containing protein [Eudoraea sp.]|uniref:Rossmann-like and DUF2520 domain-containing protein n=1 Tax=Eudoraea sp. TaxID=1979955 RepID=UPI0032673BBD
MLSIVLLGTGNLAKHLFDELKDKGNIKIKQVYGRNKKALSYFQKDALTTTNFNSIEEASIYIIAVSDDAITTVSEGLINKKGVLTHTSGSVAISALPSSARRGVFYPLQTFSANRVVNFKEVPICVEAENNKDLEVLKKLASSLSGKVLEVSSSQRKDLHLAAVFVNNFTNHLYQIGQEICEKSQISFSVLGPLILETALKIKTLSPQEAQTGPAIRNDNGTIEKHMKSLQNKNHKDIYSILSNSIQKTHGKKL